MAIRACIWDKFLKSHVLKRNVLFRISCDQVKNLSSDVTERKAGNCQCLACTKQRQRIAMYRFLTRRSNECSVARPEPGQSKNFFGEEIRSMMVNFGPPPRPPQPQPVPPKLPSFAAPPLRSSSKKDSLVCKACMHMRNVCNNYCQPKPGDEMCILESKKNSIICSWCEKIMKLCEGRCQDLSCQKFHLPVCYSSPSTQLTSERLPQPPPECPPQQTAMCDSQSTPECPRQPSPECFPQPPPECCPQPPPECCPQPIRKCKPPPLPPPPAPIPCPPPRHAVICSPEPCPNSFSTVKKGPANKCKYICDCMGGRLPPKYSKPLCPTPKCAPPDPLIYSLPPQKQKCCPPPPTKDCIQQLTEICPPPLECCLPPKKQICSPVLPPKECCKKSTETRPPPPVEQLLPLPKEKCCPPPQLKEQTTETCSSPPGGGQQQLIPSPKQKCCPPPLLKESTETCSLPTDGRQQQLLPTAKEIISSTPISKELCPPPLESCQPQITPPPTKCEHPPAPKFGTQSVPCPPAIRLNPTLPSCKQSSSCPRSPVTQLCTNPSSPCYQQLHRNILELYRTGQMICHVPVEQKNQKDIICQTCQHIWSLCKCDCFCNDAPTAMPISPCKKLCTDPCAANYLELKKKISILYEASKVCCEDPKVQVKQQEVICKGVRNIMDICDCYPRPCWKELGPPASSPKGKSLMDALKGIALSIYPQKSSSLTPCANEPQSKTGQSYPPVDLCSKPCLCTDPSSMDFHEMRSIAKQIYDRSRVEFANPADQITQHILLYKCCQKLWKTCGCDPYEFPETLPKAPCNKLCTNPDSSNYERMRKTICLLYETAMKKWKLPHQQKNQHRILCRCVHSLMAMCKCCSKQRLTHSRDSPLPVKQKSCETPPNAQPKCAKKLPDASVNHFDELTYTACLLFETSKKLRKAPSERKLLCHQMLRHCCKIQELCKDIDKSCWESGVPEKSDSSSKAKKKSTHAAKNRGCSQFRRYNKDSVALRTDSEDRICGKSKLQNQDQIDELICKSCRNIILMCSSRRALNLTRSRFLPRLNAGKQKSHKSLNDQQQRSVSSDNRLRRRKVKKQQSERKIKGSTKGSLFFKERKGRSHRRYRNFSNFRYLGDEEIVNKCWNKLYEIFARRSSTLYGNSELNEVELVTDPLIKKNCMYTECVRRPECVKKMVEDYVRSAARHKEVESQLGSDSRQHTEKVMRTESQDEFNSKAVILPSKVLEDGHDMEHKELKRKANDCSSHQQSAILKEIVGTYNPETKKPFFIGLVIVKDDSGPKRKWLGEISLINDKEMWSKNIRSRSLCAPEIENTTKKIKEASHKTKDVNPDIGTPNDEIPTIYDLKASKPDEANPEMSRQGKSTEDQRIDICLPKTKKIYELLKHRKSELSLKSDDDDDEARKPKQEEDDRKRKVCLLEAKIDWDQFRKNDYKISFPKVSNAFGLQKSNFHEENSQIDLKDNSSSLQNSAINENEGQFGFECSKSGHVNERVSNSKIKKIRKRSKSKERPLKLNDKLEKRTPCNCKPKTVGHHREEPKSAGNTLKLNDTTDVKKVNSQDGETKRVLNLKDEDQKNRKDANPSLTQTGVKTKRTVNRQKMTELSEKVGKYAINKVRNDKSEFQSSEKDAADDKNTGTLVHLQEEFESCNDNIEKTSACNSQKRSKELDSTGIKSTKKDSTKSITNAEDHNSKVVGTHQRESKSTDNPSKLIEDDDDVCHSDNKSRQDFKEIETSNADINRCFTDLHGKKYKLLVNLWEEFSSFDNLIAEKLVLEKTKSNATKSASNPENKKTKTTANGRKKSEIKDDMGDDRQVYISSGKKSGSGNGSKKHEINCTTLRGLVEVGRILNSSDRSTDDSIGKKRKPTRFLKISLQPKVKRFKEIFSGDKEEVTIKPELWKQKIDSRAEPKVCNGDDTKKLCSETSAKIDSKSMKIETNHQTANTESKRLQNAPNSKEWYNPFHAAKWRLEDFTKASATNLGPKDSEADNNKSDDLECENYPPWQVSNKKVSIVGADCMGVACATALLSQNVTNDICMIDPHNNLKWESNAMEILNNANILPSQDSGKTINSRVVIIATNAPIQKGDSYVDITQRSAIILRDMVPQLVQASPHAIFIVLTNPADLMAWYVKRLTQLPLRRCFGAGCQLGAARFNYLISRRLNVPPAPVIGTSIGRKGHTIMPVCSSVGVRGIPLHAILPDTDFDEYENTPRQVFREFTAPTMVRNLTKHYTTWGIGNTTSDIVSAIFKNKYRILSVCTNAKGFHGLKDEVWISLPCRINQTGLSSILDVQLNDNELVSLHRSAAAFLTAKHNIGRKILQAEDDDGYFEVD